MLIYTCVFHIHIYNWQLIKCILWMPFFIISLMLLLFIFGYLLTKSYYYLKQKLWFWEEKISLDYEWFLLTFLQKGYSVHFLLWPKRTYKVPLLLYRSVEVDIKVSLLVHRVWWALGQAILTELREALKKICFLRIMFTKRREGGGVEPPYDKKN